MISNKKILALGPHPDDLEFSSGATLARFKEAGNTVKMVYFSPCTKSLPEGFEGTVLYDEAVSAAYQLGIEKKDITFFNYPVREFPAYRQEILEALTLIKREFNPEIVFLPNSKDVHQDHHTIYKEGVRAFKNSSLLGYELPWNNFSFDNDFYVKIEEKHLEKKIGAIKEYKSQSLRNYSSGELFRNLASVRGSQINSVYAECFELIRWII